MTFYEEMLHAFGQSIKDGPCPGLKPYKMTQDIVDDARFAFWVAAWILLDKGENSAAEIVLSWSLRGDFAYQLGFAFAGLEHVLNEEAGQNGRPD